MKLEFKEKISERIWKNYFKRVNRTLKSVPAKQREEMILELQGHLYESFQNDNSPNEADGILNSIEKMGDPEDYLRPVAAEKLLSNASKSFNPKDIFFGLVCNFCISVKKALFACFFSIGYLFLTVIAIMTVFKIFFPDNIGVFKKPSGSYTIGIIYDSTLYTDVFGYWIIPAGLILSVVLYFILTKSLKLMTGKRI